jgi:glutathionylspermidine synthase
MLMDFDSTDHALMAEPEKFLALLAPVTARAGDFGLDLVPYPVGWLTLDADGRPLANGRPLDAVFRLFVADRVTPSAGLDALGAVLAARRVPVFTPSATWLLGNKQVLAWLWRDADGLPPADRDLVRRHVPRTEALTADTVPRAAAGRAGLVVKPGGGSSGVGVLIGRELDDARWRDGLERAAAAGGYVLQEYVDADPVPMDFVHVDSGDVVTEDVPYSVAPYVFGHRPAGACVRVGFPGGARVLNLDRGVLVSGVLVTD